MTPYHTDPWLTVWQGDCREVMAQMEPESVHCVVTSPPYWGLRDYGIGGQLGLEPTPEEYVANMVAVFREVRRVLRADGTCWVNLGDSYAVNGGARTYGSTDGATGRGDAPGGNRVPPLGLKPKDLVGIPWRVAFALQQPYYTGTIRAELDRVWLAAMLDAEGCIYIHRRQAGLSNGQGYVRKNDTHGSGLEISNTNEGIVQRCIEITGKGSISRQDKDRRQPLYRWNLRTNECRDVLREVYPYLVAKKQQARIAIGCPASGERAEAAFLAIQGLHHGAGTTLDFPEPESMLEPGWYLRSDVIWSKPNPMPESVTDRPTKAHEYVFLLSKSARYFYDADAVREPHDDKTHPGMGLTRDDAKSPTGATAKSQGWNGRGLNPTFRQYNPNGRNLRSVWSIATQPYPGAHFATFPEALVEPCVKAGTSERGVCPECGASWRRVVERETVLTRPGKASKLGVTEQDRRAQGRDTTVGLQYRPETSITTTGWSPPDCDHRDSYTGLHAIPVPATVLDPFAGSGTTGRVAQRLGRRAVLIDLNGEYLTQTMKRNADIPLGLEAS